MTPHALFDADPLTTSWLIAIAFLFVLVVAIPLIRTALAGCIYAVAVLTGRRHLRRAAARVMPRIAHLIGGIVIGTAAVAAPAMAAVDEHPSVSAIDLDRDAGTTSEAVPRVEKNAVKSVYIVRTGDTLWDIAASHLEHPTDAATTEAWKAIWRANRAVIGEEPAMIHPGQQLDLGILA